MLKDERALASLGQGMKEREKLSVTTKKQKNRDVKGQSTLK